MTAKTDEKFEMTKEEAQQQIDAFLSALGDKTLFFKEKNFAQIIIGESLIGFEFDEAEKVLSVQSLIYRFRRDPKDEILDSLFEEAEDSNCGGGRLVFNSENLSTYLQRDFSESQPNEVFYRQINELSQAGLIWSDQIFPLATDKALKLAV